MREQRQQRRAGVDPGGTGAARSGALVLRLQLVAKRVRCAVGAEEEARVAGRDDLAQRRAIRRRLGDGLAEVERTADDVVEREREVMGGDRASDCVPERFDLGRQPRLRCGRTVSTASRVVACSRTMRSRGKRRCSSTRWLRNLRSALKTCTSCGVSHVERPRTHVLGTARDLAVQIEDQADALHLGEDVVVALVALDARVAAGGDASRVCWSARSLLRARTRLDPVDASARVGLADLLGREVGREEERHQEVDVRLERRELAVIRDGLHCQHGDARAAHLLRGGDRR